MRHVTQKQIPAGGPAFDDGFALAGEVEIVEDFKMNNTKPIFFGQAATTLAAVDALLYVAEHTPPGFRGLSRAETAGESWSMSWGNFFIDCLRLLNATAAVANEGTWHVGDLWVSARKMFGIQTEPGWMRWFLPSVDGVLRKTGKSAAWVSRSPSGAMFWHQPKKKGVDRLELHEVIDRCVDWSLEVAA